jgi:hypothetical protein
LPIHMIGLFSLDYSKYVHTFRYALPLWLYWFECQYKSYLYIYKVIFYVLRIGTLSVQN